MVLLTARSSLDDSKTILCKFIPRPQLPTSVQSVKSPIVNNCQNSCRKSPNSELILYICVVDSISDDAI